MEALLISDGPKWCASMLNNDKKIEIRSSGAIANAINKLIKKYGYATIFVYCTRNGKKLFDNNNFQLGQLTDKRFVLASGNFVIMNDGKVFSPLNGKVAFKFKCYKVEEIKLPYTKFGTNEWVGCENERTLQTDSLDEHTLLKQSCLEEDEIYKYLNFKKSPDKCGYAIHINDLEILEKPKELFEFYYAKPCFIAGDSTPRKQAIHNAPQSFCYIDV